MVIKHQNIFIKEEFHEKCSPELPPASAFHFSLAPGKLLGVIELEPVPAAGRLLLSTLGLALGIGVAINLLRSDPKVTSLALQIPGPVHSKWRDIADLFGRLSGVPLRLDTDFSERIHVPEATGAVYLISGGKDTLFMLRQAQQNDSVKGRPGIYLGKGSELNWRAEFKQVSRYVEHFGLELHHVQLYQMYVSSRGILRFGNRAAWRELVTLSLARCYGDQIYTGINNDAFNRLERNDSNHTDFLSQLIPTLRAMEAILDARIETVPGELEVYRQTRNDPLFDPSGSCLKPDCGETDLCAKCHLFEIYDCVLDGDTLRRDDVDFIHSDFYLGDAAILDLVTA